MGSPARAADSVKIVKWLKRYTRRARRRRGGPSSRSVLGSNDFDLVRGEVRVRRHDDEPLELRLSDQQAVKRVAMMGRKARDP